MFRKAKDFRIFSLLVLYGNSFCCNFFRKRSCIQKEIFRYVCSQNIFLLFFRHCGIFSFSFLHCSTFPKVFFRLLSLICCKVFFRLLPRIFCKAFCLHFRLDFLLFLIHFTDIFQSIQSAKPQGQLCLIVFLICPFCALFYIQNRRHQFCP